jgi:hypothetical protein
MPGEGAGRFAFDVAVTVATCGFFPALERGTASHACGPIETYLETVKISGIEMLTEAKDRRGNV